MNASSSPAGGSARPTVTELLEQRALVQGWLNRLDELRAEVPDRVAERVRDDYHDRLSRIVDSLSAHQDAIRDELERYRDRLRELQARCSELSDELGEGRLRQMIGELSAEEWESRSAELESAIATAERERGQVQEEVQRLSEIVAQVEGGGTAPAAYSAENDEPEIEDGRNAPEEGEDLPWLDDLIASTSVDEEGGKRGEEPPEELGGLEFDEVESLEPISSEEDDITLESPDSVEGFAFLEELDRAIAASSGAVPVEPEVENEMEGVQPQPEEPDTAPPPGLKCGECGYTNDATAWYCEVCGVDLA
jgi:hypothetical protein